MLSWKNTCLSPDFICRLLGVLSASGRQGSGILKKTNKTLCHIWRSRQDNIQMIQALAAESANCEDKIFA